MGVITISRGSYSKGKEIAEKLSRKLGYECISRDVILEASQHFNIPELKLIRAIHDAPSVLTRFKHGRERYIAFIREAFLGHIQKDNVIYHGLAGHFFVRGIPNILKVRIIADIEDRVKEEMARENISEKEARHILIKDDEERRKWAMSLYGMDTKDSSLYDVVLHIDNLKADDAVEILGDIAKRPSFQLTEESQKILSDYYLGAKAHAAIIESYPSAEVKSKNGVVYIRMEAVLSQEKEISDDVRHILKDVEGIGGLEVHIIPIDMA